MKYCYTALHADLAPVGTATYANMPVLALQNFFGYGNGVKLIHRDYFTEEHWDETIYYELSQGRPVLYSGQTLDEYGHAFIVHGYDGNGYYAVNWGWNGYQDGYFLLNAMTPEAREDESADGSGSAIGGYNSRQSAVIGISPQDVATFAVPEKVVLTTENLDVTNPNVFKRDSNHQFYVSFKYKFVSMLSNSHTIDFNFAVYKNGVFAEYLNSEEGSSSVLFEPHASLDDVLRIYLPSKAVSAAHSFVEPGIYKIIPVSREHGMAEWYENVGSDQYFLTAIVSDDNTLTLYRGEPDELSSVMGVRLSESSDNTYFDFGGHRVSTGYQGLVIERNKNGRTKTIVKR